MVERIVVVKESLPNRCDICHQTDFFNSQLNYCERCKDAKAIVEKESINKDLLHNQKKTAFQNPTLRTMTRISLGILTGIFAWKIFIWPLIKESLIIFNINLSGTDYLSLNIYASTFVALVSAYIGWKLKFLDKLPRERLNVVTLTLMVTFFSWSTVDTMNYVTQTRHTLLEILSIVLPTMAGFITDKYLRIKSKN